MGADEAYLITDRKFAGADTLATSYVLSEAIKKIGNYDFVFAGPGYRWRHGASRPSNGREAEHSTGDVRRANSGD